jgi:hypothetical protein
VNVWSATLPLTDYGRVARQPGEIYQDKRADLKPPLNYVWTPLFLPTLLGRDTGAEKMPTKLMTVVSYRFRAEDESDGNEDGG